ncbi:hypothetical protein [Culturomica sp.]|uniref:hypothetical protein n=1 Tax=Culturomica sp. TaxID=1926652 RepID=UPI000E91F76D|nr:hypothetical protein [Culturomica sp.]HBO27450.1 hypothetical protein [Culturomica sp.]
MKYIFILTFVFTSLFSNAQEKITVKETFENNRFQWDEFYEKDYSGSIQDGFFVLQNKKDDILVRSIAELPIRIDQNFKITFKFLIPKISNDYAFGIIYNYEDENNYSSFLVSEKKYKIYNRVNGIWSISRQGSIILKAGKNKEVIIKIEKKGNKLIFNVDNMEAISITKKLAFNAFGFQVENANTIKVDEVVIEQLSEE